MKKKKISLNNIAAVILFSVILLIPPQVFSENADSKDENPHLKEKFKELKTKAQKDDSVSVIVGLSTDFIPEGNMASYDRLMQRDKIKYEQDMLIDFLSANGVKKFHKFQYIPAIEMKVDRKALERLESSPLVASITENVPHMAYLDDSVPHIGAPNAWSSGFTGQDQAVAILDTGVNTAHPFFAGKTITGACFSDDDGFPNTSTTVCPNGLFKQTGAAAGVNCDLSINGCDHGTHVAGIALGNDVTYSGVAKDADLVAIQVFSRFTDPTCSGFGLPSPCALTWTGDYIRGLEHVHALHNSGVVIASANLSLGGGQFFDQGTCDANNMATKAAIDTLRSDGIATVAASGNNGFKTAMGAPSCISSAISVGSTTVSTPDLVSSFSNVSCFLNVHAPGSSIRSADARWPAFTTTVKSGTSMATPHTAGSWALVKSAFPGATVNDVLYSLTNTGVPVPDQRGGGIYTIPRIQVDDAVDNFAPLPWFDLSWEYRKQIKIDCSQVAADLTDFTVLISITDTDLRDRAETNGNDILFTDVNGMQLSHEIEKWVSGTGELVAWIKVPNLSSTMDTSIFMYYDNDGAANQEDVAGTWRSEYKAVYHLQDELNIIDSTGNNNDCTNDGSTDVMGNIANAQEFDGVNDALRCGSDVSIDDIWNGGGTVSVWLNPNTAGENDKGRVFQKPSNMLYTSGESGGAIRFNFETEFSGNHGVWRMNDFPITFDEWNLVHVNYNSDSVSNDPSFLVDGISEGFTERQTPVGTYLTDENNNLSIGNSGGASRTWDGSIDEFRLYDGVLSADWATTEYNNQINPGSFSSVGIEEMAPSIPPPPWFDSNWQFRKEIKVDPAQVPSDLLNFPMLVSLTDAELGATAEANGDDILFTAADGTTQLSHEIESWNDTPNKLEAWVKVPNLSSTMDTSIFMYYDNDGAANQEDVAGTWRSEYKAVYHLHDDVNDSTANANDCTNDGSTDVMGNIADAQEFDGTNDAIMCGSDASIDDIWNGGGTLSVWLNAQSSGENNKGRVFQKPVNMLYTSGENAGSIRFTFETEFTGNHGAWRMTDFPIGFNSWNLVHVYYNSDSVSNDPFFWVNSVSEAFTERQTPTGTYLGDSSTDLGMGNSAGKSRTWDGSIDEFRIYDGMLSPDWITTEHNNQNNPGSFYSIGSQETM